jgi:hypothetical protein
MRTQIQTNGRRETGGKLNNNQFIENLRRYLENPEERVSSDAVYREIARILEIQSGALEWPTKAMREDITQQVLVEMSQLIPVNRKIKELYLEGGKEEQILWLLKAICRRRLGFRRSDALQGLDKEKTIPLDQMSKEPMLEVKEGLMPKLAHVVKVLRNNDKMIKAPKHERKIVTDIISCGGSIRTAALKLGISKDKARRAVKKMRHFLRDEFEMD